MSVDSTSTSLLLRVRQNETEAWNQLVHLYGPLVYDWCRQQKLQPADAADVSQEVFRAVARSVAKFRHERPNDSFRGWLWTIARNKILDHFRSMTNREEARGGSEIVARLGAIPDEEPPTTAGPATAGVSSNPFRRAVELIRLEFEDRTWEAFWRVTIEQRATPEVAEELGISVNAVRKAKSRVLRRLREGFGDLLE